MPLLRVVQVVLAAAGRNLHSRQGLAMGAVVASQAANRKGVAHDAVLQETQSPPGDPKLEKSQVADQLRHGSATRRPSPSTARHRTCDTFRRPERCSKTERQTALLSPLHVRVFGKGLFRHDVDLQDRVGGRDVLRRQAQLAADDVAALGDAPRPCRRRSRDCSPAGRSRSRWRRSAARAGCTSGPGGSRRPRLPAGRPAACGG